MKDLTLRQLICHTGRLMYQGGYCVAADGNITAKTQDGNILVTPTGARKGDMSPESLILIDTEGNVLEGEGKPSSELKMHLRLYKLRPDVSAVIHTHPPFGTAFAACRRSPAQKTLPEAMYLLGSVPVAEFATPGTEEVPDSIEPHVNSGNALLLSNHGVLCWGKDLTHALNVLEKLEFVSKVRFLADALGGAVELKDDEVNKLMAVIAARMKGGKD